MDNAHVVTDGFVHKLRSLLWYFAVAAALTIGWLVSEQQYLQPEAGLGYWFGIAGTTCMAVLLVYPLRKRLKAMRNWGPVRHWFRFHMFLGVLGPVLIVFHSNYSLGSTNSRVAFFSTVVVALSGLMGRYFYSKLHMGLYGRRTSIVNLRSDINEIRSDLSGVRGVFPEITAELNQWEDRVFARSDNFFVALWHALTIAVEAKVHSVRLNRRVAQMAAQLAGNGIDGRHAVRLRRNLKGHIRQRSLLVRKYAQYKTFERLFAMWHVVHYPLFVFLLVSVTVHIVAVHMY